MRKVTCLLPSKDGCVCFWRKTVSEHVTLKASSTNSALTASATLCSGEGRAGGRALRLFRATGSAHRESKDGVGCTCLVPRQNAVSAAR